MPECFAYKSHLALDINGYRIPCCMYRSNSNKDPLISNHWTEMTFDDYRNLPEYQDLKNTMEAGNWHEGCKACKESEQINNNSLRTGNNRSIKHKKTENNDIEFIEISLGNDCNVTCRMCAPNFSTDYIKRIETNPRLLDFVDFGSTDCARISNSVEEMFDPVDLSNVKIIKYIGGEPFITPQIGKLFKYLDARVDLTKTTLFTNTNATFFPHKYLSYLKKFANVNVCISVDGILHRDEYIREGTVWKEKIKNVELWKSHGFNVSGHSVINALNVDQIPLLHNFGRKYLEGGFPPHFTICTNPRHLSLNVLPPEYVRKLCKNSMIKKYFSNYQFDKNLFDKFCKFTEEFDKTTDKSLKFAHPLLTKYLTTVE